MKPRIEKKNNYFALKKRDSSTQHLSEQLNMKISQISNNIININEIMSLPFLLLKN